MKLSILFCFRQQEYRQKLMRQQQVIQAKKWRTLLAARTCPGCGQLVKPVPGLTMQRIGCACRNPCLTEELHSLIRRLGGTAGNGHGTRRTREWSDWNEGAEGFRKCGPAMWDNVVREFEQ